MWFDPSHARGTGHGARHPDPARHGGGEPRDVRRRAGPQARGRHAAERSTRRRHAGGAEERRCATLLQSAQQFYDQPAAPVAGAAGRAASRCRTPCRGGGHRQARTSPTTATRIRSPAWASSSSCSRRSISASASCSSGSAACGSGCAARRSRALSLLVRQGASSGAADRAADPDRRLRVRDRRLRRAHRTAASPDSWRRGRPAR